MVTKQVGAFEARRQFGQIMKDVSGKNTHYVVEYHGEPLMAMVPLRVHEEWERERKALFDHIEETARRVNLPPDEAEALVAEAIEAVRRGEQ